MVKDLQDWRKFDFGSVEEIKLEKETIKVKISSIVKIDFKDFPNLKRIDLESFDINSIESISFQGLENLEEFSLRENKLTKIGSNSFKNVNKQKLFNFGSKHMNEGLAKLKDLSLNENIIV
jgi:CRISPR/Cas system CMR-associated protein Cmr5 small subunit